jgi:hypothetical protein
MIADGNVRNQPGQYARELLGTMRLRHENTEILVGG